MPISKGQLVELEVTSVAYEGGGVARLGEFVIFVRLGVPGDRVRARIIRKKTRYAEALIEDVVQPSEFRVAPACPYFGVCGGCSWQHVHYAQQLLFKQQQVRDLLTHVGGLSEVEVGPVVPSPQTLFYRNKMEFTFEASRWLTRAEIETGEAVRKDFALGLHVPGRYDKVLDLHVCYLQSPVSVEIVNASREMALTQGWSAYDSRNHTGYLRNLVIRTNGRSDEILVDLVTSRHDPDRMRLFKEKLLGSFPQITTLVNSVNATRSPVATGQETVVYHGAGTITDWIGERSFTIGPHVFFQPNTAQAERLYGVIKRCAVLTGEETLFDLYCGSGGIAVSLADQTASVVGIENQLTSVEQARHNAAANNLRNCVFHHADTSILREPSFVTQHGFPNVVVVDPPRAGMDVEVCSALLYLAPERIVYVSCNPATQARDLKVLARSYLIEGVQPVDMFPHTYHIENVVALRRRRD